MPPDMPHPQVGDPAPRLVLKDQDERPVELAGLWQRQPIALFFVRHFG